MDCTCRLCAGPLLYPSHIASLSWPGNDCTRKDCCACSWPNRSKQDKAGWWLVFFLCSGVKPSLICSLDGDGRIKLCGPTISSTGELFRMHVLRAFAATTSGMSPQEIKARPSSKASGELKRRRFIPTPTQQSLMERER